METITGNVTVEKATKFVEGVLNEHRDGVFSLRKKEFVRLLSRVEDEFVRFSSEHGKECNDYAKESLKEIIEVISEVKALATWANLD